MRIFYFLLLNFIGVEAIAQYTVSIIPQPVLVELMPGSFIFYATTSVQYTPIYQGNGKK